MVRDGIYYALGMLAAAVIVAWLASPVYASVPLAFGVFFLWFFRDPERSIPTEPGLIVSPADGRVTHVEPVALQEGPGTRISIFLNVFDVLVNRAPIAGVVTDVSYRRGEFCNAMAERASQCNEQNVVTLQGEDQKVIFKQIAGLLARRIVFRPHVGDRLARGERVGMIKFGSRVDLIVAPQVTVLVKPGQRVRGGASVIGRLQPVEVRRQPGSRNALQEQLR